LITDGAADLSKCFPVSVNVSLTVARTSQQAPFKSARQIHICAARSAVFILSAAPQMSLRRSSRGTCAIFVRCMLIELLALRVVGRGTAQALAAPPEETEMPAPGGVEPQFLSSDDFHPEFGYLLPMPRKRRQIRRAAMSASVAIVIAAISVVSLVRREGGGSGRDFVSAAAAAAAPVADERPNVAPAGPVAVTDASSVSRAPAPCTDLLGSFIDSQCRSAKLRKSRSERRAASRVVSLPIGRSASVARDEASPPTSTPNEQDKVVAGISAVAKPSADVVPDPSATSAKPSTKSAHRRKPRSPDDDGLSAYGAVPASGRDAYSSAVRPAPFGGGNWGRSW
jgi:hypothetical protein